VVPVVLEVVRVVLAALVLAALVLAALVFGVAGGVAAVLWAVVMGRDELSPAALPFALLLVDGLVAELGAALELFESVLF